MYELIDNNNLCMAYKNGKQCPNVRMKDSPFCEDCSSDNGPPISLMILEMSKYISQLSKQIERIAKSIHREPVRCETNNTVLDSVFDVIRRSRNGASIAKLKEKTGLEARQLSNALYKLSKKGKVVSKKRGMYKKR